MRRLALLVLATGCVLLAACGSSKASPTPAATKVSEEAFKATAQKAVDSVQITQVDLPAGWTASPHKSNDTKLDLSPQCASFNDTGYPGAVAQRQGDDIAQSADVSVTSDAGAYRTEALAQQAAAQFAYLLANCRDEVIKALETSSGNPDVSVAVTFDPMPAGDLGDWSGGYNARVTASSTRTGKTSTIIVSAVWKQQRRMVTSLSFSSTDEFDPSISKPLMSLLAKRLADADATLPN